MRNSTNRYPATAPDWDYRKPARPDRIFRPANDPQRPPYKPGRRPFPGTPFGKRLPKPGEVGPARLPKLPGFSPYIRQGMRLVPWIGLGLTAYEAFRWYEETPAMRPRFSPLDMGFGLCCNPGPPDGSKFSWGLVSGACGSANILCGLSLQVPSAGEIPEVKQRLTQYLMQGRPQVGGARMIYDEYYSRTAPEGVTLPAIDPAIFTPPLPTFVPYPEPLTVPRTRPLPHPFRPPLSPRPHPRPWPKRYPRPARLPEDRDSVEPDNWKSPDNLRLPRPRRARKKEKEPPKKKADPGKLARLRSALGKMVGGGSEVAEAVEALYDALPDNRKEKSDKTLADKVDKIFKYGDEIDVGKFMEEMIKNQKEDTIWGHGWNAVAETFDIGSPTGIKLL